MIFVNQKLYAKVWKVTKPEGKKYIELQISTAGKNQDGEIIYSKWFPKCIGHSFNTLKDVKMGDRITITNFKLTNESYTDKDGNTKSVFKFIILEAEISDNIQNNNSTETIQTTEKKISEDEQRVIDADDACPW